MATKTAKPEFSAGARYERKALRNYLTRKINKLDLGMPTVGYSKHMQDLQDILKWVTTRQKRYDQKSGGL